MLNGINHITLAVADIDRSFEFYLNMLGFKPLCKWQGGAYFLIGETWFCISKDENRKKTNSADYTHIAFSIEQDCFEAMVSRLKEAGCESFKENQSEGDSYYFCDPDGHKLEIHVGSWQSRLAAKKDDKTYIFY